jgi:hypothetical protein
MVELKSYLKLSFLVEVNGLILSNERLSKLFSSFLVLLFLVFSLSQGVEIAHPLEERGHLPHHEHGGMVYHEPLPCDSGDHHSHFCLHGSYFNTTVEYQQFFTDLKSGSVCLFSETYYVVFELACRAIRAPPFLA